MDPSLIAALIIGLFSSVHCFGMCGGIMGALTYSLPASTRGNRASLVVHLLAYNLGRICSYALAGAIAGSLGGTLHRLPVPSGFHIVLQTIAAALMVAMGLYLAGWLPQITRLEQLAAPLWRHLEPVGRRLLPVRSPLHAWLYGIIWGWLPCGLVFTVLLWSSVVASPLQGMLQMTTFGLGTLPTVLAAGMLSNWVQRVARKPWLRQLAGISVILLGLAGLLFADSLHQSNPLISEPHHQHG